MTERPSTLFELLSCAIESRPNAAVFREIEPSGELRSISGEVCLADVDRVARALLALGVARDDKVAIVAPTSYRWALLDLGITSIGAVTVGIYPTTPVVEAESLLAYTDCALLLCDDPGLLHALASRGENTLAQDGERARLRHVIRLPGAIGHLAHDPRHQEAQRIDAPIDLDWTTFLEGAAKIDDRTLRAARDRVLPHDVASIVFTSGTSGLPKGAVLTHAALTAAAHSARESIDARAGDEALLFLPLAHVFARLCLYVALLSRTVTTFARSPERLLDDLAITRPDWLASSPRLFEKAHAGALARIEKSRGPDGWALRWAYGVGRRWTAHRLEGRPLPLGFKLRHALAHLLVYRRMRRRFGGRLRFAISGSAPLDPEIGRFLHSLGVLVLEGIGMTENASFSHVNRIDRYRFGTVGLPGPGIEQTIEEDGELLIRGPNLMREYYRLPAETRQAIDADGWLHTGDLGEIDSDGFLRIVDRKKDLLITAGGKNVAPAPLERSLAARPFIQQVLVIGDRRSYLTALVTVDEEALNAAGAGKGLHGLRPPVDAQARALIAREVEAVNRELPRYRQIKRFTIVPEFTVMDGLLTATAKQRRGAIEAQYAAEVEAMYAPDQEPATAVR